ncbi:MAG: porin family protein [Candidatus Aminicenantes bacterium]|nr:porin family protein [Candidatus Aminicenantes bacterium]MDH5714422.1 porin family protein [Candidatus Aminicenantes bacterium]
MSYRILITIIAVSICLSSFAVDLSAQEKKDDKRCEISVNLGIERHVDVPCVGLGLEYFLTPRISLEGEFNYIPKKAYAFPPRDWWHPWGEFNFNFIGEEAKYLLLCDINFLFYFDLTKIKRPTMRWFLTVGTGFQYDRMEYNVVSLSTLELDKYGFGEMHYQPITFGAGFKVNIKEDWALRILYKIHMMALDVITTRLALGLSYRF